MLPPSSPWLVYFLPFTTYDPLLNCLPPSWPNCSNSGLAEHHCHDGAIHLQHHPYSVICYQNGSYNVEASFMWTDCKRGVWHTSKVGSVPSCSLTLNSLPVPPFPPRNAPPLPPLRPTANTLVLLNGGYRVCKILSVHLVGLSLSKLFHDNYLSNKQVFSVSVLSMYLIFVYLWQKLFYL